MSTPETRQRHGRAAWIAAAVVGAIVALVATATYLSASPRVCASCHEMAPAVATWKTSAHTKVGCWDCHETPQPWYRFPSKLAGRTAILWRDVDAHRAYVGSAASSASIDATSGVSDAACLQCHDLSREITLRFGTLIKHTEHAKRNKSCISCHLRTGHPVPGAERPMVLMAQCFTCHGRSATAKAPGTCTTCHPASFNMRPESHRPAEWRTAHGKAALSDQQPCTMCHEQSFCRDCHGVEMPHPATWVKGKHGHAAVGATNRQVCTQCHTEKPDFCSMCHHKDYGPAQGRPWVDQHPQMVDKRGASFCMSCHVAVFCFNCHTTGQTINRPTAP